MSVQSATRKLLLQITMENIGRQMPVSTYLTSGSSTYGCHRVTIIPGDGIGPELMFSVKKVLESANVPIIFDEFWVSEVQNRCDPALINDIIASVKRNKVLFRGILAAPIWYNISELQSVFMNIQKRLDLYANVVRIKAVEGIKTRHKGFDIAVIREQTEGEYSALEHEVEPGVVECLKVITRKQSERIAKFAFEYAVKNGRKKVTAVHKANIQKMSDGLFLDTCKKVSKKYPSIKFQGMIVDNTCMQLASNPEQFDVMVMPNLYGAIINNLCAGLAGGAGMVPGESYGDQVASFQIGARHPYSKAAGRNTANPCASLFAAVNMLYHLNLQHHAKLIENALLEVIKEGIWRTRDMGGQATTTELVEAVIDKLKNKV